MFDDLCLSIKQGEYLGIIGPNGAGKTTFLKLLTGLLTPLKGFIEVMGKLPAISKKRIGYVPQTSSVDADLPLPVDEVVASGLTDRFSLGPWMTGEQKLATQQVLERMHLTKVQHKKFSQLSGGQQKRCFIARALVAKPDILLLDEPTAGLDPAIERELLEFFHELNRELTILQVSHDLNFVSSHVKRVLCISDRPDIHDTEKLTDDFLQSLYYGNKRLVRHDHIESPHRHVRLSSPGQT